MKITRIYYMILSYSFGYGSLLYWFAKLENETYPRLPTHTHWTDNYLIWCNYLVQKSIGKKVNFKEMKRKAKKEFQEKLKEITEEMNKRDMSWID